MRVTEPVPSTATAAVPEAARPSTNREVVIEPDESWSWHAGEMPSSVGSPRMLALITPSTSLTMFRQRRQGEAGQVGQVSMRRSRMRSQVAGWPAGGSASSTSPLMVKSSSAAPSGLTVQVAAPSMS